MASTKSFKRRCQAPLRREHLAGRRTQMTIIIMAAFVRALRVRLTCIAQARTNPPRCAGCPWLFALVCTVEIFPGFQRIEKTPSHEGWSPVADWVAENIPEERRWPSRLCR